MRREQRNTGLIKAAECEECGSKKLLYRGGKLECQNCGHVMGGKMNKYGAKRTKFNGRNYDSKYEAGVAAELELRKTAKDILDYDNQFRIEQWVYREDGTPAFLVRHKVDFRIHHLDGSFELMEAKGKETDDYKWRRRILEEIWLPAHPDHIYTVVKQR